MKYALIIGLILLIVTIPLYGIYLEKRDFNNGICPHCKSKLRYFNSDSQGGRGYICNNCNYTTWVSYKVVDKNYN